MRVFALIPCRSVVLLDFCVGQAVGDLRSMSTDMILSRHGNSAAVRTTGMVKYASYVRTRIISYEETGDFERIKVSLCLLV